VAADRHHEQPARRGDGAVLHPYRWADSSTTAAARVRRACAGHRIRHRAADGQERGFLAEHRAASPRVPAPSDRRHVNRRPAGVTMLWSISGVGNERVSLRRSMSAMCSVLRLAAFPCASSSVPFTSARIGAATPSPPAGLCCLSRSGSISSMREHPSLRAFPPAGRPGRLDCHDVGLRASSASPFDVLITNGASSTAPARRGSRPTSRSRATASSLSASCGHPARETVDATGLVVARVHRHARPVGVQRAGGWPGGIEDHAGHHDRDYGRRPVDRAVNDRMIREAKPGWDHFKVVQDFRTLADTSGAWRRGAGRRSTSDIRRRGGVRDYVIVPTTCRRRRPPSTG